MRNNSRNVLYLSYDGMTDPLGQSQVIPYLLGLQAKGYQITLVSFEKPALYRQKSERIKAILNGKIRWEPRIYHKSPMLLATFYDFLVGTTLCLYLLLFGKIGLVHCRGHYLTSLMAYPWLLMLPRTKYVFDMRGFWADERLDGHIWHLDNGVHRVLYAFFKRMEGKYIRRADYLVTLTQRAKAHVQAHFKGSPPIVVIPCCADLSLFRPQGETIRDHYRQKLAVGTDYLMVYLGSLGTWYMLPEMLHFFAVMQGVRHNSKLLFLTYEKPDTVYAAAAKCGVGSASIIVRSAERPELPQYLAACDAAIFFIKPVFSKSGSSPTKHGELMGCGLPLVCNTGVGDVDDIVQASGTGVIVDQFSAKAYRKAAKLLVEKQDRGHQRYHHAAHRYYSLQEGVEKYAAMYAETLADSRARPVMAR